MEVKLINKRTFNTQRVTTSELFFIGNFVDGHRCFLEVPHFACGWYFSFDVIYSISINCRGCNALIHFQDTNKNSAKICDGYALSECVCDISQLKSILKKINYYNNKFRKLDDSNIINYDYFNIGYNIIPKLFVELEKLVTDTTLSDNELLETYQCQILRNIYKEFDKKQSNLVWAKRKGTGNINFFSESYFNYRNNSFYFRQIK